MKKFIIALILTFCCISLNAQQWKYVGHVQAFENDNGSLREVPDGAEIYSKIISGNTVYMAIIGTVVKRIKLYNELIANVI